MKKITTLVLCLLFISIYLNGQNSYRAGDITLKKVGDPLSSNTYEATIHTYTEVTSGTGDSILIAWGDGSSEYIYRVNGPGAPPQGEIIGENLQKNIYTAFHTLPANGTYIASVSDCCWTSESLSFTNPETTSFQLLAQYDYAGILFLGSNSPVKLLHSPLDYGQLNHPFTHNPNTYDPDGDSISVTISPLYINSEEYFLPNQIMPGPNNVYQLESLTGNINWNSPQAMGSYHVLLQITEFRDGMVLQYTTRAMEVNIDNQIVNTSFLPETQIHLFPNPVADQLQLELKGGTFLPEEVWIMDATGKPLLQRSWPANSLRHQLNLEALPPAVYYLQIKGKNGMHVRRIVKM